MDGDISLKTEKVKARKEAGIGWVVFNNPGKHNALGLEMSEAATDALVSYASDPDVRVVLSSGYGEQEMRRRFAEQPAAGFIQKPYELQPLGDALRAALSP